MAYSRDNNLARIVFDQNQETQQTLQRPTGNGFQNILNLVASVANQTANPNTNVGGMLAGLGRGVGQATLMRNQNDFQNEIAQIHQTPADPQMKLQAIMSTISKYGQNPADYKDILDVYSKQISDFAKNAVTPLDQAKMDYLEAKTKQQPSLSPSLQKAKDMRTEELISMSQENPIRLQQLDDAEGFLKQLSPMLQGRAGAINIKLMQETDPQNPILGQWQNLKSVLTQAQLDYTSKTKGAISDREMALFGQAVSNDDLVSVARMTPQINKLRKSILAQQKAAYKTFQKLYNEDPAEFGAKFGDDESQAIYATNPQTKVRIMSLDGGKTWQKANQ